MSGQTFDSRGERRAKIDGMSSYFKDSSVPVSMDDAWIENSAKAARRRKDFGWRNKDGRYHTTYKRNSMITSNVADWSMDFYAYNAVPATVIPAEIRNGSILRLLAS